MAAPRTETRKAAGFIKKRRPFPFSAGDPKNIDWYFGEIALASRRTIG
jgi:hypothetical protein